MNVNLLNKFELFRNEIMCRRESNQHKATKLWDEINHVIPDGIRRKFQTEWCHYLNNSNSKFALDINGLKQYFNA